MRILSVSLGRLGGRCKLVSKFQDSETWAWILKDLFLVGNIKNDLVKYFMQHIRNGLIIDLINI